MYPNNNCNDCPECPGAITPLPLPDLSGLCGDEYPAACVIYTGENINCLGITSGMTFLEILNIFNISLTACNCCAPVDCVLSEWSDWSECECYYEGETLICGRETRIKTIITPPSNGGAPCGPTVEYRPCTVSSMCFTFGSDICESAPLGTQITVAPSGIYNDKVHYSFTICGNPQSVWWSNLDDKWHISPSLGVVDFPDFTLDNNDNYYPVSNTTTYLWNNPSDDTNYLDLLQSTLDTCPTYLVCFHLQLTIEGRVYNFFNSVAPINTPFDTGNHPFYSYLVSDGTTSYSVIIVYDPTSNLWTARVDGVIIGTLTSTTFYPYGTWVANPLNPTSYIVSATLGGTCVQPPDVDCVWTCSGFGPCNASCIQTQTCTITTPASGNGVCLPSPPLQQTCCEPSCAQPISPIVTVVGSNIQITFAAVPGAVQYTLSYTSNGGLSYTNVTSTSPSFSFSFICGLTYSGWVVTNCALLISEQTTFSIDAPPCPPAELCNGNVTCFIGGNFVTPQSQLIKIESPGTVNTTKPCLQISGSSSNAANNYFHTSDLATNGLFIGGLPCAVTDDNGIYQSAGVLKLKCTSPSSIYFAEIDRTFNSSITTGTGFDMINPGGNAFPRVLVVKYHRPTNRLFVGGCFEKYKGVNVSRSIVCLDASTGNIILSPLFKIGILGLRGFVNDIQFDESDGDPNNPKLVIGGRFDDYGKPDNTTIPAHNLVRLNFDGTFDSSFAITGTSFSVEQSILPDFSNTPSFVQTVYVDSVGDIYAGGAFHTYNGVLANHIVKIKKTGVIAPSLEFNSGTGFLTYNATYPAGRNTGWETPWIGSLNTISEYSVGGAQRQRGVCIQKIVPHTTGILVTGNFACYNGNLINSLVKLNLNGTINSSFTVEDPGSGVPVLPQFLGTLNQNTVGRCGYDLKVTEFDYILLCGHFTNGLNNFSGGYLGSTGRSYYVLRPDGTVDSATTNLQTTAGFALYVKTIMSYFI